jgi:hypothetical protein
MEKITRTTLFVWAKKDEVKRSGENYTMMSLLICLLTQYCSDYETEKNEMGGACSAYEGEERPIQGFVGGNLRNREHLGDPGVDGRIILRWIFQEVGCGSMDWIELARDRERWRALVSAAMDGRVP